MKDPAFLFYPNDYIGGTMGMTFEEKGAYIELLMMQFNRGHMTTHMIGQTVGLLWDKLQDKFIQDENGLWYNKRLEEEKYKRQAFTESRRNNIKGNNQYTNKKKKKDGHMTTHMENENVNENIVKDKQIIFSKFYDLEIEKSNNDAKYLQLVKFLFGENDTGLPFKRVISMPEQITFKQFTNLLILVNETKVKLTDILSLMENYKDINKKTSVYLTAIKWMKNNAKNS